MRVALATNFVSPYREPLYAALGKIRGWEFIVFCSCETEFDRLWEAKRKFSFPHKKSLSISYKRHIRHTGKVNFIDKRQIHLPFGLFLDLWSYKPDVVISMEMGARSLISAIYATLAKKRHLLWFYGTPHSERNISWRQRFLRKVIVNIPQAFIGMGSDARNYLQKIGVSDDKIFDAKNAIGMSPFFKKIGRLNRLKFRNDFGFTGLCYLYVGSIIPRKGLNYMIDAWEIFSKQIGNQASLILVGEGEQRRRLINLVKRKKLKNIKFIPFIEPEKLPKIYQASDYFVFPTLEDVWGLVVNEAMASGLPVICSKYSGCALDLIEDGVNGWIVDPLNRSDLIQKLKTAWEMRHQRETMGKAAQNKISPINIDVMSNAIRKSVESVA